MHDVPGFIHQSAQLPGVVFLLQCHGGGKASAMERSTTGPSGQAATYLSGIRPPSCRRGGLDSFKAPCENCTVC